MEVRRGLLGQQHAGVPRSGQETHLAGKRPLIARWQAHYHAGPRGQRGGALGGGEAGNRRVPDLTRGGDRRPGPDGGDDTRGVDPGGYLDLPVHGHLLDGALRHSRLRGTKEAAKRGEQRHRERDAKSGGGEPAAAAAEQAAQPDQGEHRF